MSKRAIIVVIAAALAAVFATVGAGAVAVSAVGHGPSSALRPGNVIWTELASVLRAPSQG
jgi:hypothetical protein